MKTTRTLEKEKSIAELISLYQNNCFESLKAHLKGYQRLAQGDKGYIREFKGNRADYFPWPDSFYKEVIKEAKEKIDQLKTGK